MRRTLALVLPALLLLSGCASTQKLTEKSEQNLAGGDAWRAWQLATRALDKTPGNPRAREAATAAGAAIGQDWQRRIVALAADDSLKAAGEVMEFVSFRENAARYATIALSPGWPAQEQQLRRGAARVRYARGTQAAAARRPKQAYGEFADCERFVPGYRDAATLADRALQKALTRVAIVPLRGPDDVGKEIAQRWRDGATQALEGHARFTRVLPGAAVEQSMTVSQLGSVSRDEAIRLGRAAGAQRVVWGTVGDIDAKSRLEFFRESVWRRVEDHAPDGSTVTRWTAVPIEVVARWRDVSVRASYELIGTRDGVTLAQQRFERTASARVLWTEYQPVADPDSYVLVTDDVRAHDPERAKSVEAHWKTVCGDATLRQVLAAHVGSGRGGHYDRSVLSRVIAGASLIYDEPPPASDLAIAALSRCAPLEQDLLRFDAVDDVDLAAAAEAEGR